MKPPAFRSALTVTLTLALLCACSARAPDVVATAKPAATWSAPRTVSTTGSSVAAAMVTVSPQGERVVAWVESPGEGRAPTLVVMTGDSSKAVIQDPAGDFGQDPETPPKLAFGDTGEWFMVYQISKNTEPGKGNTSLRSVRSNDGGRHWSSPVTVVDDGLWGTYRNDHALHRASDGTLYVAWLDARDGEHVQLRVTSSSDRGATWRSSTLVDADSPCECCRMTMASSADGKLFLAWRRKLTGGVRDMVIASSSNKGISWAAPVRIHADDWQIDGCPDAGPSLLASPEGRLYFSWWTGKPGAAGVKFAASDDGGLRWHSPVPLKIAGESQSSHVQLTRAADGTLYAAWDDGTLQLPRIVVAISHDGGSTFTSPEALSADGALASHPVISTGGSRLSLIWLQRASAEAPPAMVVSEAGRTDS